MLYRLASQLYYLAIRLAAIAGKPKAKQWVAGREGLLEEIESLSWGHGEYLWFHCASLGEFEQGRPLIERIKQENPAEKILITFFSPSGYEVRKNYSGANTVLYLPADTHSNAERFLNAIKPKAALFVKYEFWEGYLNALHHRQIPIFLVSGIFRPQQPFFRFGRIKPLSYFTRFFVQNDTSVQLLQKAGFSNVEKTGDTRFDRVADLAQSLTKLKVVEEFTNGNKLFIAGSTWPADEKAIAALIMTAPENWKFVIAPHEVSENRIAEIEQLFGKSNTVRYTAGVLQNSKAPILILDTIGVLAIAYRYAQVSYVGGGFSAGIHNLLEAAVYGHPVLFGPNHHRFAEAYDLQTIKAGFAVGGADDLVDIFSRLNNNGALYTTAATQARLYVLKNTGATQKIYNHLKQLGLV